MVQCVVLTIYDPKQDISGRKYLAYFFLFLNTGASLVYFANYGMREATCAVLATAFMVFYILLILDSVSKLLKKVEDQYLRYKNLVDFIHGVFITMDENLNISFVNKGILNFTKENLEGKNLADFPFYDKEKFELLKETKERQMYQWKYVDSKSEVFWFVIDATIQFSASSEKHEIALLIQDISLEKRMEEKEKINIGNIAALRAKNEFIASVSHEIRNPLQVISYNSENLLSKNLTKEVNETIKDIYNSTKFLTSIIGDILDYSKIEAGEMKIVDDNFELLKMVESSIQMNSRACLEKGLKMNLNFEFSLPKYVYGDSSRILQILSNIISNAIKYTNVGSVDIYVKSCCEGYLYFECRDTGIGISKEHLSTLFDPFIQISQKKYTPSEFKGWGLGLSICKKLLTIMNGDFGVESEMGKGTKFWFILPLITMEKSSIIDDLKGKKSKFQEISIVHSDETIVDQIVKVLNIMNISRIEVNPKELNPKNLTITEKKYLGQIAEKVKNCQIVLVGNENSDIFQMLKYPILPSNLFKLLLESDCTLSLNHITSINEHLNILIVDDNPLILKSLERLLQTLEIKNIEKAKNGKEAFDIFNEKDIIFDIIFMDISMPVMNGVECAKLMRSSQKGVNCKIVSLTGNVFTKSMEEQCIEWNMDEILSKPVNKSDLTAVLKKVGKFI